MGFLSSFYRHTHLCVWVYLFAVYTYINAYVFLWSNCYRIILFLYLSHSILTTWPGGFYFQATGEETEAQKAQVTHPRSSSRAQIQTWACWIQDQCPLVCHQHVRKCLGVGWGGDQWMRCSPGGLLFPFVHTVVFLSLHCSSLCTTAFSAGLVGFCSVWEDGCHSTPCDQGCWLLTDSE